MEGVVGGPEAVVGLAQEHAAVRQARPPDNHLPKIALPILLIKNKAGMTRISYQISGVRPENCIIPAGPFFDQGKLKPMGFFISLCYSKRFFYIWAFKKEMSSCLKIVFVFEYSLRNFFNLLLRS